MMTNHIKTEGMKPISGTLLYQILACPSRKICAVITGYI
jgi:hypothetical protein